MDLTNIFLTSGLTIFGGIFIYTCGQVISKFYLVPVDNLLKAIGEVAHTLIYYANYYSNPGTGTEEMMSEVSIVLRQQASQLSSKVYAIKAHKVFSLLRIIPKNESVLSASSQLIGLSNSIKRGDAVENDDRRRKIAELLNMKLLD